MESKITISYDYEQKTPLIKIQYKNSDDERDRMVKAFLELMGGEVSFTKFQYELSLDNTITIAAIRPIPFPNLKDELKTMKAWIDHIEDNVFEDKTWQYVNDNSQAFHKYLTDNGVAFIPAGHDTGVSKKVNLFNLGANWGRYKEQNMPRQTD